MVGLTDRLLPVPTNVPPQLEVYQLIVSLSPPPPPIKVRVVLLPSIKLSVPGVMNVGFDDFLLTVKMILSVLLYDVPSLIVVVVKLMV